jgi:hypothetical protein
MVKISLEPTALQLLKEFIDANEKASLVASYLCFVEHKFQLKPVLSIRDKIVFQDVADAISALDKEGKLARETEIKISYETAAVNEGTKKIYICPFSGKVFGDNTHPNPQDAIYDWVAKCPENNERIGGLKVKRFYISEDPQIIAEYAAKNRPKAPISKVVFSSALNNKLFYSKEAVIEDFKQNYLKPMSLADVQNQTRFQIDTTFMNFIEKQLTDDKIAAFVESLTEVAEFAPHVERWLEESGG